MKKFLLFGGYTYYPNGGWGDFINSFDTLEEAKEVIIKPAESFETKEDWYHVVDSNNGQIIYQI
jgi:hypothetical protein